VVPGETGDLVLQMKFLKLESGDCIVIRTGPPILLGDALIQFTVALTQGVYT
jgi:hypothetical protein